MSGGDRERWAAVDAYVAELLLPRDPVLEAARSSAGEAGIPAIEVAPNQGRLLELLARIQGARRILELGTLAGYSTIWLARALPPGGRLVTLEAEPRHAAVARENLERAGVAGRIELRVGRAADTLAALAAEGAGPFDLVFIDADKQGYPEYLGWALRLSRPGTVLVADNVVRHGEIAEPGSQDPRVQGVRRFLELVAAEPRLAATAIQTVGVKGHDGFVLAVVGE